MTNLPLQENATAEISVGLVSPRRLVLAALHSLLDARGVKVLAEAATPAEAHALIVAERPHVLVIEFDTATDNILATLPELVAASDRTRILLLTAVRDTRLHEQVVQLGASGIVLTDHGPDVFLKAIAKVHAGELWLDRALTAGVLTRLTRTRAAIDPDTLKIQSLTRREREIVVLVGEGLKNRQIAERLFISEATVRNHLTSILDKFDLDDRFELAVYSFRHGLVAYPQTAAAGPAAVAFGTR